MSDISANGHVQSGFGKLESVAGDAIGSENLQAQGGADKVEGKAKEAVGSAKEAVNTVKEKLAPVADQAKDVASRVGDQAKQAYGAVSERAQDLKERVDPIVQEKPYLALLAAAGLGFLAARLLAPGGPRVIYVKPRD